MSEQPRTEAGRSLHGGHCRYPATCDYLAAILAIEAQAVALDHAALDHAALVAAVEGLRNPFTWFTPHAAYEQARESVLALLNTLPAAPTIDPQKGDTPRVNSDQDTST